MRLNYLIRAHSSLSTVSLTVYSNYVGTPEYRIYEVATPVTPFAVIPVFGIYRSILDIPVALDKFYQVDIKDDTGIITLGKIATHSIGTCLGINPVGLDADLQVTDTQVSVSLSRTGLLTSTPLLFSIDGGNTWKSNTGVGFHLAVWTNAEVAGLTLPVGGLSFVIRNESPLCTQSQIFDALLEATPPPTLTASTSKTDVTTNLGTDGTGTVNVLTGAGQYEVKWLIDNFIVNLVSGNPIQSTTRGGRSAGTYSITVKDLTTLQTVNLSITINEPGAPPPPAGEFLQIPNMNSITFVEKVNVDNCSVFQNMDNTLFCEQEFVGFSHQNYFQKVAKCDNITIQFLSDFSGHEVTLWDYITNTLAATYVAVLKEANINQPQEEGIFITYHLPNQSRVYFNVGGIPVPASVGDPFEVFNSPDGFNGNYLIATIQLDVLLGQQYLVINKVYGLLVPASFADARFVLTLVPFNVFETIVTGLGLLANGKYFMQIKGLGAVPRVFVSEPIDLQLEHKGTNLVRYRNIDNAFDMTYTTGLTCQLRVESTLFKRVPDSSDEQYRNTDLSSVKLSAKRYRKFIFELWMLPPYMHEKLAVIFGHDVININGVRYQSDDKYQEPKYLVRYPLSNSQIVIEQYGWFNKYNSDDLGSVDGDGGFILANGGFIKR